MKFLPFLLAVLSLTTARSQEYFQQEVNYNIQVELDDTAHTLKAFESLTYHNNSNEALTYIYFHLWPNGYKSNETELGKQILEGSGKGLYLNNPDQAGYIDSLDFEVDGKKVSWEYDPEHIDICKVLLNEPLQPGDEITITTPFFVKLPSSKMSRLGHIGQSYHITQWYPKPAVYDHKGWHPYPYLDMGEFYSEFGSFEVAITLPDNYYVGATGKLQNQDEVEYMQDRVAATRAITSYDQDDKNFPESSNSTKTLRYKDSNIHDFAWFADKRYNILQGEVELPHSGRTVKTWAYFPNHQAELWKESIQYINDAVYYYSLWYGDYPYDNCSAVCGPFGDGGMEYPQITLIHKAATSMALELVIAHEVGHNWFYGILGSNERLHPWMDEGLNTFSEMRYMAAKYPTKDAINMQIENERAARFMGMDGMPYASMHQAIYQLMASRNADASPSERSEGLKGLNYSAIAYSKTGLSFQHLMSYLGEDKMNECMREYYETWKFRHPYPEDLRVIFEKNTGEDLSWLFDQLMGSTKKLDYGISKARSNRVLIKNHGKVVAPVLVIEKDAEGKKTEHWVKGFEHKYWVDLKDPEKTESVELYGWTFPEVNSSNNFARTKGLFKNTDPIEVRSLGLLNRPGQSAINILPAGGWNHHNGMMVGAMIYSDIFPMPRLEYQIVPMYSLGNGDLAGLGKVQYHFLPSGDKIQRITAHASARQFGYGETSGQYYQKVAGGLDFKLYPGEKAISNVMGVEYIYASHLGRLLNGRRSMTHYFKLNFDRTSQSKLAPYKLHADLHGNNHFAKAQAEFTYKHIYLYNNSLDIRGFAGVFLYKDESLPSVYNFNVSGVSGGNDYLFNQLFLARFEAPASKNVAANQFANEQGGFAAFSPFGSSEEYIISCNVSSSLPIKKNIPLQAYANVALVGDNAFIEQSDPLYYEAGVKLQVLRGIFEIYAPLLVTEDVRDYLDASTSSYFEQVRFTLNLSELNLIDKAKDF